MAVPSPVTSLQELSVQMRLSCQSPGVLQRQDYEGNPEAPLPSLCLQPDTLGRKGPLNCELPTCVESEGRSVIIALWTPYAPVNWDRSS